MVQEMPTNEIRSEPYSCEIHDEKLNSATLLNFSRSLENLDSETMYSKWKRSRPERRTRFVSVISDISSSNVRSRKDQIRQARKNRFHALQENVFVPRSWTIGASAMEVIKEQNAVHCLDAVDHILVSNVNEEKAKLNQRYRVTLQYPNIQLQPKNGEAKMKPSLASNTKIATVEQKDKRIGENVMTASLQSPRNISEDFRGSESPPIVAKFLSEESNSTEIEDSNRTKPEANRSRLEVTQSMEIEIQLQSKRGLATPTLPLRSYDTARPDTPERPAKPKSRVVKDANSKTSRILNSTNLSLGCTYAVVSQPLSRAKETTLKNSSALKMHNGLITEEERDELVEEFKKLKKVSLELDKDDIEDKRLKALFELSGVSLTAPLRRFSDLDDSIDGLKGNSSRTTAKTLLESIAKASEKTEKERIQQIEEAFEWIRQELTELRAQDKDIMRTFARIQAEIRNIKHQRSLINDMDETYEYQHMEHSPVDLDASFTFPP